MKKGRKRETMEKTVRNDKRKISRYMERKKKEVSK
jgi:hypothetical protein